MNQLSFSSLPHLRTGEEIPESFSTFLYSQFQTDFSPAAPCLCQNSYCYFFCVCTMICPLPCHLSDIFYMYRDAPNLSTPLRIEIIALKNMKWHKQKHPTEFRKWILCSMDTYDLTTLADLSFHKPQNQVYQKKCNIISCNCTQLSPHFHLTALNNLVTSR